MKTMQKTTGRADGFTLIETLMALAIFTIGILGLFGMQSAAIKENFSANSITTGATWAMQQTERVVNWNYLNAHLNATGSCSEVQADVQGTKFLTWKAKVPAANQNSSGTVEPVYRIYWAVANDCLLTNIPNAATANQEQKPKYVRIIVTRNDYGTEKVYSDFSYIKQNARQTN